MKRLMTGALAAALSLGGATAFALGSAPAAPTAQDDTTQAPNPAIPTERPGAISPNDPTPNQPIGQPPDHLGEPNQPADTAAGMGESGAQSELSAKVKSVDEATHSVTIEVPLAADTQVTRDGEAVPLSAVKPGDEVRASFSPGTHEATHIDVTSKGSSDKGVSHPSQPESNPAVP